MKRYFYHLSAFLLSLFLCTSFVKADTTITLSDSYVNFYNSNIESLKSLADNYLSTLDSSYLGYIIFLNDTNSQNSRFFIYYMKFLPKWRYRPGQTNPYQSYTSSGAYKRCAYNDDYTLKSCSDFNSGNILLSFIPAYMTYQPLWGFCDNSTVIYTYGDNSYTSSCQSGVDSIYPTTEFLLIQWTPSSPLDDFYSTILTNFSTFCESLAESEMFLSIFVIYVLIIIFMFVRRFIYGS